MQEKKLSTFAYTALLSFAAMIDVTQVLVNFLHFIPAIGSAIVFGASVTIGFTAQFVFYFVYKMHGVSFMETKRFITKLGTATVNLTPIPLLNMLPINITYVLITSHLVKKSVEKKAETDKANELERAVYAS